MLVTFFLLTLLLVCEIGIYFETDIYLSALSMISVYACGSAETYQVS